MLMARLEFFVENRHAAPRESATLAKYIRLSSSAKPEDAFLGSTGPRAGRLEGIYRRVCSCVSMVFHPLRRRHGFWRRDARVKR